MHFGDLTWVELRQHTAKVVVMPIASLEQHGQHLPLLTDTMIGGEIARRAEAELAAEALFLPLLWIGSSHHHLPFATVSLSSTLYIAVLKEMIECVMHAGFTRIFLLNAHGGNEGPGTLALQQLQLKHSGDNPDLWLAFSSWFGGIARVQISQIEALEQKFVTHACELETSAVLRMRPELVHMDLAHGTNFEFDSEFQTPDASGPSRVFVPRSFDQITKSGALGHPETATVEKGEAILQVATREVVAFVREFKRWPARIKLPE